MKRFLLLTVLLLSIVSCSKEDEIVTPPPTPTYTLVFSAEEGGSVSSEGGTYAQGSKITVTATPDAQYLFKEWSDGSITNPREITVNNDLTLTASFIKKTYPLAVTIEGEGTVQEEVIIQGSTSETEYNAGTTVRLTATPNEGWVFAGWSGDIDSTETVIEVLIEKGMTIVALFMIEYKKEAFFSWGVSPLNPRHSPSPEFFNQGQGYEDVNGDGLEDVLLSSAWDLENNTSIDFWIAQTDGSFVLDKSYVLDSTEGLRAHKTVETDVNNDGNSDFIVFGADERDPLNFGGNFSTLLWTPEGYRVIRVSETDGFWFHGGGVGDLNQDGFVDVITAEWIWWGDGSGNFSKSDFNLYKWCDSPLMYEVADYNQDGFNDIILSTKTRHDRTTIVYGGNGWDDPLIEKLPIQEEFRIPMDVKVLDIDGDGDLDILELRQKNDDDFISTLISNTSVDFSEALDGGRINGNDDIYGWTQLRIADVDGDGVDDIVAENYHDGDYNGLKLINSLWKKWRFTPE